MWKIEKIVSKGDYQFVENHLGRLLNSDEVVRIHGLTVEMETAITENVLEIRKLRANQKQWDA